MCFTKLILTRYYWLIGPFYRWVNWGTLRSKCLNSTSHRWVSNHFNVLSHLILTEPQWDRQPQTQPHKVVMAEPWVEGRACGCSSVISIKREHWKAVLWDPNEVLTRNSIGLHSGGDHFLFGQHPWRTGMDASLWGQVVFRGVEREGDTTADCKRSQSKVWRWPGAVCIWRSGSRSFWFEGGSTGQPQGDNSGGNGVQLWILSRAW